MSGDLVFAHAGFGASAVPYLDGWELQRRLHQRRVDGDIADTCLLLEHQAVYTAGKRTGPLDRPVSDPGVPVIDVDRGGKITWHGPGQLVGYPIVRLADPVDVIAYVRALEEALIRTCADVGVAATRVEGRSGVWLTGGPGHAHPIAGPAHPHDPARPMAGPAQPGTAQVGPARPGPAQDRKVAAIGIRVSRGVTMHGFALNCDCDLAWFDRIVPCGIRDAGVTSLSAETGRPVTVAAVTGLVEHHLAAVLGATSRRRVTGVADLLETAGQARDQAFGVAKAALLP